MESEGGKVTMEELQESGDIKPADQSKPLRIHLKEGAVQAKSEQ